MEQSAFNEKLCYIAFDFVTELLVATAPIASVTVLSTIYGARPAVFGAVLSRCVKTQPN